MDLHFVFFLACFQEDYLEDIMPKYSLIYDMLVITQILY